jgi:hypothetical protein
MCDLKRVRTGAIRYEKIEPQRFVAGNGVSASARVALRISYVHASIKVLHFVQPFEIHRVIGVREALVNFILQMLVARRIEQQVVKDSGQCRLDGICTCDDGECAIGEDVRDGGLPPFQPAIIDLGHGLSVINKDQWDVTYTHKVTVKVVGYRPAIQTFLGHIVTKISECQSVVSP